MLFFGRCCILFAFNFFRLKQSTFLGGELEKLEELEDYLLKGWSDREERKRKKTMEVAEKKVSAMVVASGMISSVVENGQVLDRENPSES